MNAQLALEQLAEATWDRLRLARDLGVRFGEETLTDLILLELKRALPDQMQIAQMTNVEEARSGADWEWWIRRQHHWVRYVVQAKRLNLRNDRYTGLTHRIGSQYQFDVLRGYALRNGAMPIYCLYNFSSTVNAGQLWHCGLSFNPKQLGCSVAAVETVDAAAHTWGGKTFDSLHTPASTLPWRCLIACPQLTLPQQPPAPIFPCSATGAVSAVRPWLSEATYDDLPPELERAREVGVVRYEELPVEYYRYGFEQRPIVPRRICFLDPL